MPSIQDNFDELSNTMNVNATGTLKIIMDRQQTPLF